MAQVQVDKLKADLNKKLHEDNQFNNVLSRIEAKTGVDRLYMVLGVAGAFALYLIFGHFAELVCNLIGFIYPAYVSMKAIESADKNDDTQWLTYWVVFAVFSILEFAADSICGWFPVYWLVKCVALLYLSLPFTRGADKLYQSLLRPLFMRHKDGIDKRINQFGQDAKMRIGEASKQF